MINLDDQLVGGRFAVGKSRYKLLDELWVYSAKDSQKGKDVSLLVLVSETGRNKLDGFRDYLRRYQIGELEATHFLHDRQTYFYAAVDLADKRYLEEIFQNWQSGRPAPVLESEADLPPTRPETISVTQNDRPTGTPKIRRERAERLKFFSIGVVSILVLLAILALFAFPSLVPVASPTPTSTPQIFILKEITAAQDLITGEALTIPANSEIVILNADHAPCEVLANWNGTQVLIKTSLIFPERNSGCK